MSSQTVTLAWESDAAPEVAGFRLYYGFASGNYAFTNDAGNLTTTHLLLPVEDETYYIVATAYSSLGIESPPSNEITYYQPPFSTSNAPIATNLVVSTDEDRPVQIDWGEGASSTDGTTLVMAELPATGTVGGSVAEVWYSPNPDFHGEDGFRFIAIREDSSVTKVTVKVVVHPVNDPPVAYDATLSAEDDSPVELWLPVSDNDGDALAFTILSGPAFGTLSGDLPPLVYTPTGEYARRDSFTFKVNDGTVDSGTATVWIIHNRPPLARDHDVATEEDVATNIVLSAEDPDQDPLRYEISLPPLHGVLTGQPPALVYTPDPDFNGLDDFHFLVEDVEGALAAAVVRISVTPVNDAPRVEGGMIRTQEDTETELLLAAWDDGQSDVAFSVTAPPAHGSLNPPTQTVAPDNEGGLWGLFTYLPDPNYYGPDRFSFQVSDGELDSDVAVIEMVIEPVNDAPTAESLSVTTLEDTAAAIQLGAADVESRELEFEIVTPPLHGVLEGQAPDLVYVPTADYYGLDHFTFRAGDGQLESELATVSLTIEPVDDPPVATSARATTREDTAVTIRLEAFDADHDELTFEIVSPPSHGTLSGQLPEVVYLPVTNLHGIDQFTFRVNDGSSDSAVATVTLPILSVNDAPVAFPQNLTVVEGISQRVKLGGRDVDGDRLTFKLVERPAHGTLTGQPPELEYQSDANFSGADRFTFQASDGAADSAVTPVQITVLPQSAVAPSVVAVSLSGEVILLEWSTIPGKTYRVLFKDQISAPAWSAISEAIVADGTSASWTGPLATASGHGLLAVQLMDP